MRYLKSIAGFSLAEISVTVVVIGVLAGLAIPRLTNSVEITRMGEGIQILQALLTAQRAFNFENPGLYADNIAQLDVTFPTPVNFAVIDNSSVSSVNPIAKVVRNGNLYDLCVSNIGVITCDENGAGTECAASRLPIGPC